MSAEEKILRISQMIERKTTTKSLNLQYVLDKFLKESPFIGLEYVVEYLKDGIYSYKCLLCGTNTSRSPTILHVNGLKHMTMYLRRHHPELFSRKDFKPPEYKRQVKAIALQVQRTYGRKRILHEFEEPKEAGSNPKQDLKISSTSQLQHFKTNDDFMKYLQNFEMKNDDDYVFLQQITKNCTKALMNYQEEQTKAQASSTLPSNSDPKSNTIFSDKAKLSSTNSPRESLTPSQISLLFRQTSEVSPGFFESLEHMDVSEVLNILKRVVATNPEFREIQVPDLIKYLQDTGKMKNS